MEKLDRIEAIDRITVSIIAMLDSENRESYILDWWGIDEEDEEFSLLSEALKNEILLNEDTPVDVDNCKYDQLIKIALCFEYIGVTNTYLSKSMAMMKLGEYQVDGDVELLEICPCCHFRTLRSRENYDICRLCDWEDCGVQDQHTYSGPNHMTLGEAQENFKQRIGDLPLGKWIKA